MYIIKLHAILLISLILTLILASFINGLLTYFIGDIVKHYTNTIGRTLFWTGFWVTFIVGSINICMTDPKTISFNYNK